MEGGEAEEAAPSTDADAEAAPAADADDEAAPAADADAAENTGEL